MRWAGHVACMGELRNQYTIFDGKSERVKLFGRSRDDNIKEDT
jgi:hypothetical protein